MTVSTLELESEIEYNKNEIALFMEQDRKLFDMVPVVYIAKLLEDVYHVGWNFEKIGVNVHDMVSYDNGTVGKMMAEIVYVWGLK